MNGLAGSPASLIRLHTGSSAVRLLAVADRSAREYYEREALLGGWPVRQLDRQIAALAYERTTLGASSHSAKDENLPADAHVRDPFVLEFLNLKDEYSELELENALIRSIEQFLLELGNDFAFVARQGLNYAREHWAHTHENPPVGLILCSEKDAAVAQYALSNLANQVLAREYQLHLPNEAEIAVRIDAARRRRTILTPDKVLTAAERSPGEAA